MRALVLGGTGMLGRAVMEEWRRRDQAVLALSRSQADICRREVLLEWVEAFRPSLIINCAAFTQVDLCETERQKALEVNGRAVANVVAAAAQVNAKLVHISSDYVFDGSSREPYLENAATGPVSVYGESKLLGEQEALQSPEALVVRASWLFGPGGPNFVTTIRRLILNGQQPLKVVDDQLGCPTYTPYLARALWRLVACKAQGVFHYQNRSAVTWHGFASEIANHVKVGVEILPVTTAEFPRPAERPAYSVLDVKHYETTVGLRVEPWGSGLAAYLDTLGGNP